MELLLCWSYTITCPQFWPDGKKCLGYASYLYLVSLFLAFTLLVQRDRKPVTRFVAHFFFILVSENSSRNTDPELPAVFRVACFVNDFLSFVSLFYSHFRTHKRRQTQLALGAQENYTVHVLRKNKSCSVFSLNSCKTWLVYCRDFRQ